MNDTTIKYDVSVLKQYYAMVFKIFTSLGCFDLVICIGFLLSFILIGIFMKDKQLSMIEDLKRLPLVLSEIEQFSPVILWNGENSDKNVDTYKQLTRQYDMKYAKDLDKFVLQEVKSEIF